MFRKTFSLLLLLLFSAIVYAQKVWTLEECIAYAHKNNLTIKQRELDVSTGQINLKEAKMAVLPSLNASVTQAYNFGRSIDPFTNQYAAQTISNNRFGLSTGVTLFNGFRIMNNIKLQNELLTASKFDLEVAQNDIGLAISNAYMQVLFAMELIETNKSQVASTEEQLLRMQKFLEAGRVAENSVLEISAQLANEQLNLVNAENQLNLAYLTLWQLLDIQTESGNVIQKPMIDTVGDVGVFSAMQLYTAYAERAPELKAAERRTSAGIYSMKMSRGMYYPTLFLGADVNTLFSENFVTPTNYITTGYQQLFDQNLNGYYLPISVPTRAEVTPFGTQLNNNLGQTVALSLSIPIFNNWRSTAGVKRAKLNMESARINQQITENNTFKQVSQAYAEFLAAKARYEASSKNLAAQEASYRFSEARLEAGLLTSAEYLIQKNNAFSAKSNFLQSKYELLFRTKIIDFYKNGTIKLEP